MAKKTLIFVVMVAVSIVGILSFVGWSQTNQKRKLEKKKVRMAITQKLQEIKIVAVEEKILPPTKKAKKRKKKRLKKKQVETAKTKKPVKRYAAKEKAEMKDIRPQRLFPANYRLNHRMTESGRRLIESKISVPIVQASYDRIGFNFYLKKMRDMGGRLFVGDAIQQKILAEVIVDNYDGSYRCFGMDEGKKDELDGMALFRPREIANEILVDEILNYARQTFGARDLRCVVLLPLDKEAAILGALKEYLNKSGYNISQFDVVWGNYLQKGWQVGLKVERGRISKTGEIINLDMTLTM
jgi:Tfp pilus assembly protein PilE